MATPAEPLEEEVPPQGPERGGGEEERTTRRILVALLAVLGIAALGLLVLLFWLLRPKPGPQVPGEAAGYPIRVTATIYGYGQEPDELLKTPLGVAFDGEGNVWISDTGRSRVEEYTTDGTFVRAVGTDEALGKLYTPYGITVDPDRARVYVADFAGHNVQMYSTSGAYIGHLPADDQNLKVFGPDGFTPYDVQIQSGRIVVSSNDGLYFFDMNGHVVARWGGTYRGQNVRGVKPGMFNFPDSFDVDPESGRIYVADSMNRRIVALDENGRWLWVSGTPDARGKITGFWQLPRGIQVGPDGNLYVVDTFRFDRTGMGIGHLVALSPDGDLLSEFGRAGSQDGAFNFPEQLAVDPSGLYAIADRENNRVVLFTLGALPEPDQMEARRYEESFSQPENVWATPSPAP